MRFILIILILIAKISFSQNLVPNGSFENHFDCSYSGIENANFWCGINGVAYDNVCNTNTFFSVPTQSFSPGFPSYQVPKNGAAYINFGYIFPTITAVSRYPHVKLIDTLEAGKIYCVTYFVSLWNDCKYSADKFGALLTATPFNCTVTSQDLYTGYAPQVISTPGVLYDDTLGWQEVSGSFTAIGNEAYLTLGNFFPNTQHTYSLSYPGGVRQLADYYLDDVSVEEVQIAKARNDTLIYQGDSVIISKNKGEALLYNWQPTAGLSCTNCPNPKASPSVTTTYTVTKTQCKAVTSDVITVTVSPVGIRDLSYWNEVVGVSPNPTSGNLKVSIKNISEAEHLIIKIVDVLGKEVLWENYAEEINISTLENGIYFLSLYKNNQLLITKKVVKQ